MISPLVSVIIPTYNRVNLLKRALESVFNQSFQNIEVIVVDDGSTDGTKEYVESLNIGPHLRYFFKENEKLPAKTRNYGIEKAKGKYVAFLDCDDYWLPGKLEKQVNFLESHHRFGLTCSSCKADIEGNTVILNNYGFFKKNGKVFWWLLTRNFVITSTVLIRRELLIKYGFFNDRKDFRISEDYDLWLRISTQTQIKFIREPLAYYQFHDGNISGNYIKTLDVADRVIRFHLSQVNSPKFIKRFFYGLTPIKKYFSLRKDKVQRDKYLKQAINTSHIFFPFKLLNLFL